MPDYAEILTSTGQVIHVKHGGLEPDWLPGRRGVVLDPHNPNHRLDLTLPGHYTARGKVFTLHPPPDE